MRILMVMIFGLNFAASLAARSPSSRVIIDGNLNDWFWQKLTPGKLAPMQAGAPAELGGEVRATIAGKYLYLSARLLEPDGRVTARSMGRNPQWEGGGEGYEAAPFSQYLGAPEGEDYVRFFIRIENWRAWVIQVGPLGAYSVKWREPDWYTTPPDQCNRFLVAARIGEKEWSVEAAIPLDQLGAPLPGYVRLAVERNRAERPGTPAEQWRWPEREVDTEVTTIPDSQDMPDPQFRPPVLGNHEPSIKVGFRKELPALESGWRDPAWRAVPTWALHRNAAAAPLPRFPTEVKLVHDGHTLAVLARCIEPEGVLVRTKEGPGLVGGDDSFQVYLSTSGSSFVQYAINPKGYILDAIHYLGGDRLSLPHTDWTSQVRGMAWQGQGEWFARLDLPLEAIGKVMAEGEEQGSLIGEVGVPREWRVLLLRSRPGRDGEPQETSVLPVTQSTTPFCPARYRRLVLVETAPSQLAKPPLPEQSGSNLAFLPDRVLSEQQRAELNLSGMMEYYFRSRELKILEKEKRAWDEVNRLADWERFRDPRLKALGASLGPFPNRCPLETRITHEFKGSGYRRLNLAFQSQPGLWVTANLYLPAEPRGQIPGIIIIHSHHFPKTQLELQDMGVIWARAGCAVLVPDQLGYGERIQEYPWERDAHQASYTLGIQLQLPGENLTKWRVWDTLRAVDLLLERKDVNQKQIIVLGAVAGGGDIAAVAAALDPRIVAVAPFNFGDAQPAEIRSLPEKNKWPLDLAYPGWGDMESTGVIPRAWVDEFLPWFICASVAPRRFVYSYELGWNVADEPAWSRYRKVFGFYHALDNLADAHGFGVIPGPGEAFNIGPAQRRTLYPTFEHWFGIPIPFSDTHNSIYENVDERSSPIDRRPISDLTVLTPSVASELHMRSVHELMQVRGEAEVNAARAELTGITVAKRRQWLQAEWAEKLGDIEPNRHPEDVVRWTKNVQIAQAEAITLTVEPGILVPLLLLRSLAQAPVRPSVVVAVAEDGKELFLARRRAQIEALLKSGVAVCLPDVRGTGETSPNPKSDLDGDPISEHDAGAEVMLGSTMLGKRLKDLRTVLAYLYSRRDLDSRRVGLWGQSFVPANPVRLLIDENLQWAVGPEIEQRAQPLGGLLALLGALYEDRVGAIAVDGGLAGYLSVLDDRFAYVPADVIVPGVLEAGDIADVAARLAPRPILMEGLVDGRNRLIPEVALKDQLAPLFEAYGKTLPAALTVRAGKSSSNVAEWFRAHLE
jgi:dienelactone hydrolase